MATTENLEVQAARRAGLEVEVLLGNWAQGGLGGVNGWSDERARQQRAKCEEQARSVVGE